MTKKILITGGNGFIGRSLYEFLSDQYFFPLGKNIYCLGRQELDLLDSQKVYDFIREHKFDVVIHAATYDAVPEFTTKDTTKVLEYNLKMFFNIARCKEYFGKMIYFGSGSEAGRENFIPTMTEEYIERNVPEDQYAFSKHVSNEYAQLSDNIYNLRIFGLFGKYDDWRYRFISNACCKAVLNKPVIINQDVMFDYVYINDFAEIVRWFIENSPERKSFNICSGHRCSYYSLAKKIVSASSKDLEIITKKEGLRKEYSGNNMLLKNTIKDFKFTSTKDAIKELYNWYDDHRDLIDEDLLLY